MMGISGCRAPFPGKMLVNSIIKWVLKNKHDKKSIIEEQLEHVIDRSYESASLCGEKEELEKTKKIESVAIIDPDRKEFEK